MNEPTSEVSNDVIACEKAKPAATNKQSKIPRSRWNYRNQVTYRKGKAPVNKPEYSEQVSVYNQNNIALRSITERVTVNNPVQNPTISELEEKLASDKNNLKLLINEIRMSQAVAISLRQEAQQTQSTLEQLTGKKQLDEIEPLNFFPQNVISNENLMKDLSSGCVNIAIRIATSRKELVRWIEERSGVSHVCPFEEECKSFDDNQSLNSIVLTQVSEEAIRSCHMDSDQLQKVETCLKEKDDDAQNFQNRCDDNEYLKSDSSEMQLRSPNLLARYRTLLTESNAEKVILKKKLSELEAEYKRTSIEMEKMKMCSQSQSQSCDKWGDDCEGEEYIDVAQLKEDVRCKDEIIKMLTDENSRLKNSCFYSTVGDDSDFSKTDRSIKNKRIQAELDPKHRSSRRQIQILKGQLKRLEAVVKRFSSNSRISSKSQDNDIDSRKPDSEEEKVIQRLSGIIDNKNRDICRLEDIVVKMQGHHRKALLDKENLEKILRLFFIEKELAEKEC